LLISAAPLLLLGLIPLEHAGEDSPLLRVLLAFAAGGLLGDVFLHLLPHTMSDSGDAHSLGTGLWLLTGILAFFLIEKAVRAAHDSHGQFGGGHSHSHTHDTHGNDDNDKDDEDDDAAMVVGNKRSKHISASGVRHRSNSFSRANSLSAGPAAKSKGISSVGALKVHGWLNLVADFAHNFTDGLAIGATFQFQQRLGWVTTAAVLLHEVPHEIGDFAILLQCGMNKRQAMAAQAMTAVGALAGTLIGLLTTGFAGAAPTVLAVTAGGFLYIAMTSVLPALLLPASTAQSAMEVAAIVTGVALMIVVAMIE